MRCFYRGGESFLLGSGNRPALTEERIRAFHEAGIEVNCWTVDDPAEAERLFSWGVDYITSNVLE